MRISLHLSGGLRAVLAHLPETMTLHVDGLASLRDILVRAGINPLLVMVVIVDGERVDKDVVVDQDAEIVLVGPMAGG